jgi:hypothetical protein
MVDYYYGADFEDESLISDEEGRKLNFRAEINHENGMTVHGMICNKDLMAWGVQLMTSPDGPKIEFMCDPESGKEIISKMPVEKEEVDARYLEKARKQVNRQAMYSRMLLTFCGAWLRTMMKSDK